MTSDSAGAGRTIRVELPEMPGEESTAVTREIAPVLRDLRGWLADGYLSGPVAPVVSDSRYPAPPRLANLEEPEVVFYDRDGGYARPLPCGGGGR